MEGAHIHLECRLEPINDPKLRVEWFVNNKAIKIGSRFRTTHDFGYVALDVLQSYAEDSGTYMCRATNKLGEAVNSSSVSIIGEYLLAWKPFFCAGVTPPPQWAGPTLPPLPCRTSSSLLASCQTPPLGRLILLESPWALSLDSLGHSAMTASTILNLKTLLLP